MLSKPMTPGTANSHHHAFGQFEYTAQFHVFGLD